MGKTGPTWPAGGKFRSRTTRLTTSSWTPERRRRQAELIRTWKPWKQATGPSTPDGKAKASRNAWTGGHWLMLRELSRLVNAEVKAGRDLVDAIPR